MRRALLAPLLFLLCAGTLPARAQGSPDVDKAISDLEYKWAAGQKEGKPEVVAPLLADRFVNTDTDARSLGKSRCWLASRAASGNRMELAM
jgi:hypothetical protein